MKRILSMNEILSYIMHPEISMSELIEDNTRGKWKNGVKNWFLLSILIGLLTVASYKLAGYDLTLVKSNPFYGAIIDLLETIGVAEGGIWLALVAVEVVLVLIIAGIRAMMWINMLFLVSKLFKDIVSVKTLVDMSIYAILIWIALRVFRSTVICVGLIIPFNETIGEIQQILLGLTEVFSYWYIILFIIGYSIVTNSTFRKSGLIVLAIQGCFWIIVNLVPVLDIVIG